MALSAYFSTLEGAAGNPNVPASSFGALGRSPDWHSPVSSDLAPAPLGAATAGRTLPLGIELVKNIARPLAPKKALEDATAWSLQLFVATPVDWWRRLLPWV